MIRVAVLDDHPALLAGLRKLLAATADLDPVVAADSAERLWKSLDSARADVVVLDYDIGAGDGLALCQRIKQRVRPPGVVIYAPCVRPSLTISARLAGADALVDKHAPATDLLDAIRRVAAGESLINAISPAMLQVATGRLASDDVPVVSMLLEGTPVEDIADILATDRREVLGRARRVVELLRPKTAS